MPRLILSEINSYYGRVYELSNSSKCPICHLESRFIISGVSEWKPPKGLDPDMRRVECRSCNKYYYIVIDSDKDKKI